MDSWRERPGNGSLRSRYTHTVNVLQEPPVSEFDRARDAFLAGLESDQHRFADTLAFIDRWYEVQPSAFRNGAVHNAEDQNQGSCKVLGLARLLQLTREQTLACFGEHYREVLATPEADNHHNLRRLQRDGLTDITFDRFPLTPREHA